VFTRSGATWTQQAYLKASNTDGLDAFGVSVTVDGDTIVVGAHGEDSNATGVNGNQADNSNSQAGAAYVFVSESDMSISIKGLPNPLTVGSQLTYQLRIRNAGPGTATGVTAVLTLSPSETFVSATSACSHAAGVVTCTIARAIQAGAGATPSVTVTENQAGLIQTTATVSSNLADLNPANNTATERTRVLP
jgi:uncharacterized repeat protein (TIGR01451 family)